MKIAIGITWLSFIGVGSVLSFNNFYICEAILTMSLYKWGWIPLKEFE